MDDRRETFRNGLTASGIVECNSDEELFRLLSSELQRCLPALDRENMDTFVERLQALPLGLRSMASIYQLDVSIAHDDLGWHFANWHHRPYCDETLRGLRELEAAEAAEIFAAAYSIVLPYWDKIGQLLSQDFKAFASWYGRSELDESLEPFNNWMWQLCKPMPEYGLLSYWLRYARKYPSKVVQGDSGDVIRK